MSTTKDDGDKLSRTFNPGETDWQAEAEHEYARAHVGADFKAGYAAAFDCLLRTDDLTMLLSNFALMLQKRAKPTHDHWLSEARLFVTELRTSPRMEHWFPDWRAPRVVHPDDALQLTLELLGLWKMPSLNDVACDFLQQESIDAEEEAKKAKQAKEAEA